jgi:integrase
VLILHKNLRDGIDPLAAKVQGRAATRRMITFKEAAERYIAAHEIEWKDKRAWPDTMRLYVYPLIGGLPVNQIDDSRVLAVLEPIWQTKTTTAVVIRARIETVLDFAASPSMKYRDANAANPAAWTRLKDVLAKPSKIIKVQHRPALPYAKLPEFMAKLATDDGIPAAALAFTILTCARAGQVAGATWQEIDFAGRTWTIPAERMKGGKVHRVPLTAPALAVLHRMAQIKSNSNDCIFLGRDGSSITAKTILRALLKIASDVTTHGFRSTFSTWCAETNRDHRLCETSLAHVVGSAVERSYQRSDLLDKRRVLMEEWARHCGSLG